MDGISLMANAIRKEYDEIAKATVTTAENVADATTQFANKKTSNDNAPKNDVNTSNSSGTTADDKNIVETVKAENDANNGADNNGE